MQASSGEQELAPTFDHASSLGRNETDARRQARLTSRDQAFSLAGYASRARSAFYRTQTDRRTLSTLGALSEAAKLRPRAAREWIGRLQALGDDEFRSILDEVPQDFIGDPAREFAYQFLLLNRGRIVQTASDL